MDELVAFLKSYGVPIWAIVLLVALSFAVRPLLALIQRVKAQPTLRDIIKGQFDELERQRGQLYADMRLELSESKEATCQACEALRSCEALHKECLDDKEGLTARVVELERISQFVREPRA